MGSFLQPRQDLSQEDAMKLGMKNETDEVEKFVQVINQWKQNKGKDILLPTYHFIYTSFINTHRRIHRSLEKINGCVLYQEKNLKVQILFVSTSLTNTPRKLKK